MESDGTQDMPTAAVEAEQQVVPSREELVEFLENIVELTEKIGNSMQCMKDSIQRGQCTHEVMQDLIDDAQEDIQNIMDSLEADHRKPRGSKKIMMVCLEDSEYVQQITLYSPGGIQTIKTNLQSMQTTLRAIQDDIKEIEDASKNMQNDAFGDDWFRWEDWKVDKEFMTLFYDSLDSMMKHPREELRQEEAPATAIFRVNPIVQMLIRKKGDKAYEKLDIDKMIRFFYNIGVKYWYAIKNRKYDPDEAINSLKGNPYITNIEYIKFLNRNPAREN